MPLLLLLCLMLACLPISWDPPILGAEPQWAVALTGGAVVFLLALARGLAQRTIGDLVRNPAGRSAAARAHGLRRLAFSLVNLAGFGATMAFFGWGWVVREWLTVDGLYLPGAELLIIAPYVLTLVGSWVCFYDAERAIHRSAPDAILRRAFWTRRQYVGFALRHHALLVFMPVLLTAFQLGVFRVWPGLLDSPWAKLTGLVGIVAFIVLLPSLIPLFLGLKPMPPGRIRDRLEAAAVRLGVRYRNLYVWDTRQSLATAMVAGIVPHLRQIVFTDLLLASLTEEEIEAVFGHEVGHVRHGHLIYYACFLILSFMTLGAVYQYVQLSAWGSWLTADIALILPVVITGAYLFLVFGFVSRKCERQADVFGCRAVSCANPACSGHEPTTRYVDRGNGLCPTGVRTFVHALERVEAINGMSREEPLVPRVGFMGRLTGALRLVGVVLGTWQHSTIARRVAFLDTLAVNPGRERAFQRWMTAFRLGLMLVLAGGVLTISIIGGWETMVDGLWGSDDLAPAPALDYRPSGG